MRGVSHSAWVSQLVELRRADIATALRLVREKPELFEAAAKYAFEQVAEAVLHVERSGRPDTILLST